MKINHFFTIASALALALTVGHSVSAADFKSFKDAPSDYTEDSPKSWSGPYIGIGAGISSQDVEESHVEEYPTHEPKYGHSAKGKGKGKQFGVVTTTENEDDGVFTARLGNDWQRGPVIWGLFTDINYYGGGNDNDFSLAPGARLGWLLDPRILAYINGGVEIGNDTNPFFGGGLELMIGGNWSIGIEPRIIFAGDDDADNETQVRAMLFRRF